MKAEPSSSSPPLNPSPSPSRLWRVTRRGENALLVLALSLLVLLPLVEMSTRLLSLPGISGSSSFVQHFTLILAMLGGAVAARDGRLLSLSTFTTFLKGAWKEAATIFSSSTSAAISVFLVLASIQVIKADRDGGLTIAYGVPIWVVQLIMPVGFGLVALRLLWLASKHWWGRLLALLLFAGLIWLGLWSPFYSDQLLWPGVILVVVATLLGAPIFAALGGLALVLMWDFMGNVGNIPAAHYSLTTNSTLPAIPLFTLAGYFLAEGGASQRLIRVFNALVGRIRGGPAIATALVCAYFTAFTGASGVTILALGGLLMPVLLDAKYSERDALGMLTASGSLGVLLPPCLPLILYSVVAGQILTRLPQTSAIAGSMTMERMFLGGILPGFLLVLLISIYGFWKGGMSSGDRKSSISSWRETGEAIWEAKWELLIPVVALGALFGGFATPVQAAALTALYAFFAETFIYRDLSLKKDAPKVMTECGLLVGGVLLILGMAMGFTNYLVTAEVPSLVVTWVQERISSPWAFLLALNLVLLVVGCIMDIFSAIVVVVPLIIPLGVAFGIDPVHLGIIFLANLQLGYLTPPVGMNLFLASYRFNKPILEVVRASLPMFIILLLGVLLITYLPFLSTFLPRLLD